jgi:hypothetical protein
MLYFLAEDFKVEKKVKDRMTKKVCLLLFHGKVLEG